MVGARGFVAKHPGRDPPTLAQRRHALAGVSLVQQITLMKNKSGREDLNLRPLAPHASALAGLRHAPICRRYYSRIQRFWQQDALTGIRI